MADAKAPKKEIGSHVITLRDDVAHKGNLIHEHEDGYELYFIELLTDNHPDFGTELTVSSTLNGFITMWYTRGSSIQEVIENVINHKNMELFEVIPPKEETEA